MAPKVHAAVLPQRVASVLDWTVLFLGILSLSVAVTATIIIKTEVFSADSGDATPAEWVAG